MEKKVLGILGGMGTIATAHFFRILADRVKAEKDQDYPRIIIDNNHISVGSSRIRPRSLQSLDSHINSLLMGASST